MYDPGLRMLSKYMRSLIDGAITNQEKEENINVALKRLRQHFHS